MSLSGLRRRLRVSSKFVDIGEDDEHVLTVTLQLGRRGMSLRIRPSVNSLYTRLFMGKRVGFGFVGFGFLAFFLELAWVG